MQPLDSNELLKARDLLRQGDVVAIPTETVYGLAASIDSPEGLKKIFETKERPFFDPLIVHVASFQQAKAVTSEFPPLADFLARWFWPGPLTLVLPKASSVDPVITSGLETVAVRFPAHPLAQDLIRLVGSPLAAPSANKFGRTSPSTAAHVRLEFQNSNLLVIDGGPCQVGLESTVITFAKAADGQDEVRILRPGGITQEDLEGALVRWSSPVRVVRAESSESPGHLKHHYMPVIPLILVSEPPSESEIEDIAKELGLKTIPTNVQELDLPKEASQAARLLYSEMRRLAESGADLLYVRETREREGGLWAAVWDRLTRAASWTSTDGSRLSEQE
jgi:L-threonylcarbamoyladenylate synthase